MQSLPRHITVGSVIAFLLIAVVSLPVFYIVFSILEYLFTFQINSFDALLNKRTLNLLWRSISLASSVSIMAALVSLPFAYFFANYRFRFKKVFFTSLLLPFFIPAYIYAISWIGITGESGFFNFMDIYGFWGTVFILVCWLFPVSFLFMIASFRKNVRLEEPARLVSGKFRIFRKITMPIILPGLIAALITAFIMAITNFSVAGALRLNVFPTEIFVQFGAFFNHQQAIFLSLPYLIFAGLLVYLFFIYSKRKSNTAEQRREQLELKQLHISGTLILHFSAIILLTIVLVIPLISLISGIGNFKNLLDSVAYSSNEIWQTILYNALAAFILTILGFSLAYFRNGIRYSGIKSLLDFLIVLQIAIPGTIYGIVLTRIFQSTGLSALISAPLPAILITDIRYLPIPYYICMAGLSRIPKGYLEASSLIGHPDWIMMQKIIFPLIRNSIFGALIIVFVLCLGELDSAIMVYPPGFETISLRIYSLLHYGANEMVNALSVIQIFMILILYFSTFRWIQKSIPYHA